MENKTPIIAKHAVLLAVIAGIISGLIYVSPRFSPALGGFLNVFAGIPLFVAGFGFGTVPALIATAAGIVVCTVVSNGISSAVGAYALTVGIPVSLVVVLSLRKKDNTFFPVGKTAAWLAGYMILLFAAADFYIISTGTTLQEIIRNLADGQIDLLISSNRDQFENIPEEYRAKMISGWKETLYGLSSFYPGIFMISSFISTAVNAFIALYLLNNSTRAPLRKDFGFYTPEFPHWVAVLTVVTVVTASLTTGNIGFFMTNIAMLLMTVEMFKGLSVIHAYANGKDEKDKKLILWAVYLSAGMLIFPLLLIALLGIADHFRKLCGLKK